MTRLLGFVILPLLIAATHALGEEPAPQPAPLNLAGADQQSRVNVPCTLEQVLYTALLNNATLEIARLDPDIADTGIAEARGVFDPAFTASATQRTSHGAQTAINTTSFATPTGLGDVADSLTQLDALLNQLAGPQETVVTTQSSDVNAGVSQLFTTGTQISLTGGVTGIDSDRTDQAFDGNLNLGLRQPLLRGMGRRIGTITIRQARNQAQQSRENFAATVLSTIRQVEQAYWDLVLARELLAIREFGVTLAQEQYDRSDVRLKVGKGIEADVLASRAELATRQADLSDAHADIHARTLSLLQLIKPEGRGAWRCDLDPGAAPPVPGDALDEEVSVTAALENRPELKQANLEIARQDLDVRLRKNDLMPDLDLVASYGRNGDGTSFGGATSDFGSSRLDDYSVGVEFSTSLTKRSEKARLQRAKFSAEQAARSLRRTEDAIEAEARQAVVAAQKLMQRIDADKIAIDARKEELTIEQGRNQAGKTTTLDVLQVQRDLLQTQTNEATDRVGCLRALAALYAAEGTLLERRGISVSTED